MISRLDRAIREAAAVKVLMAAELWLDAEPIEKIIEKIIYQGKRPIIPKQECAACCLHKRGCKVKGQKKKLCGLCFSKYDSKGAGYPEPFNQEYLQFTRKWSGAEGVYSDASVNTAMFVADCLKLGIAGAGGMVLHKNGVKYEHSYLCHKMAQSAGQANTCH